MVRHASMLGLGLAALLCAAPSLASANRLKLKSYQIEPTRLVIELEGTEALGEPWLRVSGSTARIWFPDIETLSRFEQGEAEAPLKSLMLRPGTPKTALLLLELRADRSLAQRDVEITRDGTRGTIRVALPPAIATEAGATTGAPASTSAAPPAAELTAPNSAPAVALNPAAQPVAEAPAKPAATQPAQEPAVPVPPVTAAPAPGFKQAHAGSLESAAALPRALQKQNPEPQLLEPQAELSSVQLLLLLTVVLGAIYGLLRIALRRRAAECAPTEIQVLGSKRLGARHQLLIVRALGQDHLISVNGGRTERIATSDTLHSLPGAASATLAAPAAMPSVQPKSPARLGLGLSSALRAMRGHELFASAEEHRTAALARAPIGETPFGAELLDFVRTGESRNPGLSESEAIAGLVRLRKRSS
jgi:flagellar biogenesis protein FliO